MMMSAPALKVPGPTATPTIAYPLGAGSTSSSSLPRVFWLPPSGSREVFVLGDEFQVLSGSESSTRSPAPTENGLLERVKRLTAIHELAPGVRLKTPLVASIEELPDYATASIDELSVYGDGTDVLEALSNLKRNLLELRESLTNPGSELARRWTRLVTIERDAAT